MEKVWYVEDPDEQVAQQKTRKMQKNEMPLPAGKNPAAAYSLSIFFWGGGQLYTGQAGKGLLFLFGMLVVYALGISGCLYRNAVLHYARAHAISFAKVFLFAEGLLFCALFFWIYNAGHAYHAAVKARTTPFRGVRSNLTPLLCSLLLPGWGQFLNGQPIKGSIFAGFAVPGLFTLVSIPAILLAWPFFEVSDARFAVESLLVVLLLFMILIPFLWLFAGFDALKVSLDDIKKEPLLDRLKYANNRRRTQGWIRGIFPHIKLTFALLLFLALLVVVAEYSFPKHYYHEELAKVQAQLRGQGMTMVPDLINKLESSMKRIGM